MLLLLLAVPAAVQAQIGPDSPEALANVLNSTNLTWSTSGNANWFSQTNTTHDGVSAARSGAITNSQSSTLQTTVTGPGTLSYWCKVSSQTNYDVLQFKVGSTTISTLSGEVNWQQRIVYLGAGAQTLQWVYLKDASSYSGQDAAWLDEVAWVPGGTLPFITAQPVGTNQIAGLGYTLRAAAVGTPTLSYQWQINGTNLPGAAATNLSLVNLQAVNAGDYRVIITNGYGAVTSQVASVTVTPSAPVITTQPSCPVVNLGQSVTLSVGAFGTSPLGYQWLDGGAVMAGVTSSSFTMTNLQASDDGHTYCVVVSNAYGAVTSTVVALAVNLALPDAWNLSANGTVNSTALQPDGSILLGGAFSTLGGMTCSRIGRVNADGSLDTTFNPGASSTVYSMAVQPDGKILAGGAFTNLGGMPPSYLGRLNANGSVDTNFNPGASSNVFSIAVQPDGKILAGGNFTTLGGSTRSYLGRLNAGGTLDTNFNLGANSTVYSIAVQPDGKILVGGGFDTLGGVARGCLGRLGADGSLDTNFNLGANSAVYAIAVQPEGNILVGGGFTNLGGVARSYLGRLSTEGILDDSFNPGANGVVYSLALQTDGKILVGGSFTALGGQARKGLARINADGSLDNTFNPSPSSTVYALALQADGSLVVGGSFGQLAGLSRVRVGRLVNPTLASQNLTLSDLTLTWLRGGSGAEVWRTTFEASTNGGVDWFDLGAGARISGGWQLAGVSLPPTANFRARGYTTGGQYNGSSGCVEMTLGAPSAATQVAGPVTQASATLNGLATANGWPAVAWFEWGTNTSYGQVTAPVTVGSGCAGILVRTAVTGVSPGATHHYRLVASNQCGVVRGLDGRFTARPSGGLRVTAWGVLAGGNTIVPTGLSNVVAIAGGHGHSMALRANGTVSVWGTTYGYTQTNVPAGLSDVVAIAGGWTHCLAVKSDGSVVAWGTYGGGSGDVATAPSNLSNVVAVAGGNSHSLALKADGTVAAWGSRAGTSIPGSLSGIVAIAAGSSQSLALRADGTVVGWDDSGNLPLPSGLTNIIGIAAGPFHCLALRANGTVIAWPSGYTSTSVPAGLSNVVAVAAGLQHSIALKADGTVVVWGDNSYGQRNVPAGLSNVTAIASGDDHCLALGPNIAPTAKALTLRGGMNQDLVARPSFADINGDLLTYRLNSLPAYGSLYQYTTNGRGAPITAAGTPLADSQARCIFAPAPAGFGVPYDTFSLVANDGDTDSPPGVVTVNIIPAPVIPVAGLGRGTNGSFQLSFPGLSNLTYTVWASTNLTGWTLLGSATQPTPGQFYYNDATATNSPLRFYRVRSP